jgi:hypothetical protein
MQELVSTGHQLLHMFTASSSSTTSLSINMHTQQHLASGPSEACHHPGTTEATKLMRNFS